MPGKKKGKAGGKKKKKSGKVDDKQGPTDPVRPEYIVAALQPRERLMKLLTSHPVKEKELYGMQISAKVLEKLSPEDISNLRIVFEAFDFQERGFIGPSELRKAMKVLGFKLTRDEARQRVHDACVKARGVVEFNEFLDIVIDKQGDDQDIYEEIVQGFKLFDQENTGKLSMDDLIRACKESGVKLSNPELQDMMEVADLNGDGFVDKEEFVKIMLQTNLF